MSKEYEANIKIAALGDIHIKETSRGEYKDLFAEINKNAHLFVLCGDLTDFGKIEEAEILVEELSNIQIPIIAVLGNHDVHSNQQEQIVHTLMDHKIQVLEGT